MGDMLELGKHTKKLHIQISKVINLSSIGSVNVFGKAAQETYKKTNQQVFCFHKAPSLIY